MELSAEYERKVGHFLGFEIIRLKPAKLARDSREAKLAAETRALLQHIKKDDLVVLCDERGQAVSSIRFSEKLVSFLEQGRPRVVIVIGGAFGVGEELRHRADWTWSLSPLVLNHHIAQSVALEQLYRALAIWKKLPYHNE